MFGTVLPENESRKRERLEYQMGCWVIFIAMQEARLVEASRYEVSLFGYPAHSLGVSARLLRILESR